MDLEIDVSRLKLVKANYQSQKYAMEDRLLKYFPRELKTTEERLTGFKEDIALYEQHMLRRSSQKAGLTDECFIRSLIRKYVPKEQPNVDYLGMMRLLSAIGNNINQIAAQANATGFFRAKEFEKQLSELLNRC